MKTPVYILLLLLCTGCNRTPAQNGQAATATLPDYETTKKNIDQRRLIFQQQYSSAVTTTAKDTVIQRARAYITDELIKNLLPAWYCTPWAFEGTTTQPRTGSIACGYFVTTVLQHAGFNLPRIKWACVPSETMIKSITDKANIKHYSNTDVSKVEAAIKSAGIGIYIAGLDMHVGFIINTGNEIRFVHSNYYDPLIGVVSQPLNSHNPLRDSKYRVIGKILNDEMIRRWIMGEKLDV